MTLVTTQLSDGALALLLIWGVLWLFSLATVLYSKDFDPVTKLTWVVVVIFVPFFGILLYWSRPGLAKETIDSSNQLAGTPWENDPNYTTRNKQI